MLLEFAESGHPIFRATIPLSGGQLKSKGRGKLSIHFAADQDTVDTIYRIILCLIRLMIDQGNLRKSKPTKSKNQINRKPR